MFTSDERDQILISLQSTKLELDEQIKIAKRNKDQTQYLRLMAHFELFFKLDKSIRKKLMEIEIVR